MRNNLVLKQKWSQNNYWKTNLQIISENVLKDFWKGLSVSLYRREVKELFMEMLLKDKYLQNKTINRNKLKFKWKLKNKKIKVLNWKIYYRKTIWKYSSGFDLNLILSIDSNIRNFRIKRGTDFQRNYFYKNWLSFGECLWSRNRSQPSVERGNGRANREKLHIFCSKGVELSFASKFRRRWQWHTFCSIY